VEEEKIPDSRPVDGKAKDQLAVLANRLASPPNPHTY
jgi:hypothetical protein